MERIKRLKNRLSSPFYQQKPIKIKRDMCEMWSQMWSKNQLHSASFTRVLHIIQIFQIQQKSPIRFQEIHRERIAQALNVDWRDLIGGGTLTPVNLGDGVATSFYNPPITDLSHIYTEEEISIMRDELLDYFDNHLNISGKRKLLEAAHDYAGNRNYSKR